MDKIMRGDIIWVDLGNGQGLHIQSGRSPCLVISTDKANTLSNTYNVLPGTTKQSMDKNPVHYKVLPKDISGYLGKATNFMAEQICTIDRKQILCKVGHIEQMSKEMCEINKIIMKQLTL